MTVRLCHRESLGQAESQKAAGHTHWLDRGKQARRILGKNHLVMSDVDMTSDSEHAGREDLCLSQRGPWKTTVRSSTDSSLSGEPRLSGWSGEPEE